MTRSISSAFFEALQVDDVVITELITLNLGGTYYRWTSSNQEIVSSGYTYEPFPGRSSGMEESLDLAVNNIDFTFINSGSILSNLISAHQFDEGEVTIERVLINSPDLDRMPVFTGKIGDYSYNRDQVTGSVRNKWGSAQQQFPYYTYIDNCVWRFGSDGCTINVASFTTSSVTALSGTNNIKFTVASATINALTAGAFEKGRVTFTTGSNSGNVRSILKVDGNEITLYSRLPYNVLSGDLMNLRQGCRKRLVKDCRSRFNNSSHYLGFPWIPREEFI